MNDNQIEKIARDMCGRAIDCKTCMNIYGDIYQNNPQDCDCWEKAKRLADKRYQAIQKNAIILTKDRYEELMKHKICTSGNILKQFVEYLKKKTTILVEDINFTYTISHEILDEALREFVGGKI